VMPHPQPIFDDDGNVVEAINMLVDITEHRRAEAALRESEERFRTMADQAPVMIWMTDERGAIVYLNTKWIEFTGMPAEAGYGKGWIACVHPDDREATLEDWMLALPEQKPHESRFRYRNAQGAYAIIRASGTPRYSSSGEFAGYIGMLQDVTLHETAKLYLEKEVEARTHELKRANIDLAKSNNELEQFAYVASHDLQEPLRKIQTFADLLHHHLGNPEKSTLYITKITECSERMMTLISDLLNFSRLSKDGNPCSDVDLEAVVENVRTDFELVVQQKKATISSGKLPVIEGIPLQINQLFYNLVGNSLKFSRPGQAPVIRITARALPAADVKRFSSLTPGSEYVEIIFRDNGIGFRQEYAEQIFTIFQRLNDRQAYSGTGIGLALCRKIAVNHHGEIFALSKENEGAAFHVILPRVQPRA
jgi:two-component system, chemotaxis family, CheB/CheR fusion protein